MALKDRLCPDIRKDITDILSQLRMARLVGDEPRIRCAERRLNWLIENKLPRKDK